MTSPVKYSVVVPTLNEKDNIAPLIEAIEASGLTDYEVVIVDENSPDGTYDEAVMIAQEKPFMTPMLNEGNPGLSPSIVQGFSSAQGEFLCCMDGDLQHDIAALPRLFRELEESYDMVIGSRYVEGGGFKEKWSLSRVIISRTAALMTKFLLKVDVKDPMSGYFLIRKDVFKEIKPRLNPKGFKIMLELLCLLESSEKKYRITESGIIFGLRIHGESKLSFRVIFQFLQSLLDMRKSIRKNNPVL